jgi:hypothetical protein
MTDSVRPIRRVVTGNDEQGRSRVLFDSAAPRVKSSPFQKGTNMTDIWTFDACPAIISGDRDDGDLPFHFEPPLLGGRLRVVESAAKPADYDTGNDAAITAPHPPRKTPGGTWERGGQNLFTTRTHKSETLDYGFVLTGERFLITDDGERPVHPGSVVVQIGSWHAWSNPREGSQMAFMMMGAKFDD